jgi:hypothetical protein
VVVDAYGCAVGVVEYAFCIVAWFGLFLPFIVKQRHIRSLYNVLFLIIQYKWVLRNRNICKKYLQCFLYLGFIKRADIILSALDHNRKFSIRLHPRLIAKNDFSKPN